MMLTPSIARCAALRGAREGDEASDMRSDYPSTPRGWPRLDDVRA
jgi:hypothetical protein